MHTAYISNIRILRTPRASSLLPLLKDSKQYSQKRTAAAGPTLASWDPALLHKKKNHDSTFLATTLRVRLRVARRGVAAHVLVSPLATCARLSARVRMFFSSTCTADDGYGDRPTCARHPSYLPVLYVPADISEGVRGFASDIYLHTRGVIEHAEQALLPHRYVKSRQIRDMKYVSTHKTLRHFRSSS